MSQFSASGETEGSSFRSPVLLHGFSGSGDSWGPAIVDGLSGMGRIPVRPDLPGHGRWSRSAAGPPKDLKGALDAISEAGEWPTDLIGYSMGGRLALHFAAAFPGRVRSLVLESASPGLATPLEREERVRADAALAARIVERGVEDFVDYWASLPLFESRGSLPARNVERLRAVQLQNSPEELAAVLRGLGTGALPSLWEALPVIDIPVLLIVGALDLKFVRIAEALREGLPRARLVVVPEAGHTVHLERPGAWLRAVASFLSDQEPGAAIRHP